MISLRFFAVSVIYFLAAAEGKLLPRACTATNIEAAQQGGTLVVQWDPPTVDDCAGYVGDRVVFVIEGGEEDYVIPLLPGTAVISVNPICKNIEITIQHLDASDGVLGNSPYIFTPTLTAVQNLLYQVVDGGIKITWDKQDYVDECDGLTYNVNYGDGMDKPCSWGEDCIIDDLNIESCDSVNIVVTPSLTGFNAFSATIEYTQAMPGVTSLSAVNTNGEIDLTFTPIEVGETCGQVSYNVKVTPESDSCFNTIVAVQPVADTANGAIQTSDVNLGPGIVINLQATVTVDAITASWQIPVDGEQCGLSYVGDLDGQNVFTTHATNVEISSIPPCTKSWLGVTAAYGTTEGRRTEVEVEGKLGRVVDLVCRVGTGVINCSWGAPENSEECSTIDYEVSYSSSGGSAESEILTVPQLAITAADCTNFWITVRPRSSENIGQNVEIDACTI